MSENELDEQILQAIRQGHNTRQKLMAIERLRHRTWAVIGERLKALGKGGKVIASKTGWRIA